MCKGSTRSAPNNHQLLHASETRVAKGVEGKKGTQLYIPRSKFSPRSKPLSQAESLLLEIGAMQPLNAQ